MLTKPCRELSNDTEKARSAHCRMGFFFWVRHILQWAERS